MNRDCQRCGIPLEGKRRDAKFCSLRCSSTKHGRTCTVDGCSNKHRARGLCAVHWKRQYGKSGQWTYDCGGCGRPVVKSYWVTSSRRPTCSDLCRAWLQHGPVLCRVPATHASRSTPSTPKPTVVPFVRQSRPCAWCGDVFLAARDQLYCNRGCKTKHSKVRRRGQEAGSPVSYTWTEVIRVFLRFDRKCAYCEQGIESQPDPDHVVPLSRGGSNAISNILPCCQPCNSDKRDLLLDEWNADRKRRGLSPRVTSWKPGDPRVAHLGRSVALPHAA